MEITLKDLGHGALEEKFQDALVEVVKNTCDPNTDSKAKRKLSIELIFTPDKEDRTRCDLETKVSLKLGATRPLQSMVSMGFDRTTGEVAAIEHVFQPSLFGNTEGPKEDVVETRPAGKIAQIR